MPTLKNNDGTNLFYKISGQGDPIVLIAGGFCDHHVWDDVINSLRRTHQIITYDNRGIGNSDVLNDNYTIELLAKDLSFLLGYLKIPSAHIVGHSMGGFIAQYFAAFYSEKVLSLSLLSSLLMMNKTGSDYLNILINGIEKAPETTRQQMPEIAGRIQTANSILQQAKLCIEHDARHYINKIIAPTLIISGLNEPVVTIDESQILASSIKSTKRITQLNCGHMLQREAPHELTKELLSFINDYKFYK